MTWPGRTSIGRMDARASADPALAIRGAYLTFSDGSSLNAQPDAAGDMAFSFRERDVTWARLTVTTAADKATSVGLSSLRFGDDEPLPAGAGRGPIGGGLASSSSSAGSSPSMAVDAGSAVAPAATGSAWRSGGVGEQWLQVDWPEPHELASVQIYGSPDGRALSRRVGSSLVTGALFRSAGLRQVTGCRRLSHSCRG